jgi:hypothetical protein
MFESRYGRPVAEARAELASAATDSAQRIVVLLQDNRLHGTGPYPLSDVHRELTTQHEALMTAIARFPLALAVDIDQRLDPVGAALATLMGDLTRWLVLYRNLTDFPAPLRSRAHRELLSLLSNAHGVLATLS